MTTPGTRSSTMYTSNSFMDWDSVRLLADNWTWVAGTLITLLVSVLVIYRTARKKEPNTGLKDIQKEISQDNCTNNSVKYSCNFKMSSTTSEDEFFDPEYQPPTLESTSPGNDDTAKFKATEDTDGQYVADNDGQHVTDVKCGQQLGPVENAQLGARDDITCQNEAAAPEIATCDSPINGTAQTDNTPEHVNIDPGSICHASLDSDATDDVFYTHPTGLDPSAGDPGEPDGLCSGVADVNSSQQRFRSALSTSSSQQVYSAKSDTDSTTASTASDYDEEDDQLQSSNGDSSVNKTELSALIHPLESVANYEKVGQECTANDTSEADTPTVNTASHTDHTASHTGTHGGDTHDKHSNEAITTTSGDIHELVDIVVQQLSCSQTDTCTGDKGESLPGDNQEMCPEHLIGTEDSNKNNNVIQTPQVSEQNSTASDTEIFKDKYVDEAGTTDQPHTEDQNEHDSALDTSSLSSFLPGFKDKMASYGVKSEQLNTLVAKSSMTLSPTLQKSETPFKRQNTFPLRSPQRSHDTDKRTIKVVRMSSVDSTDSPKVTEKQRSTSHNGYADTNDSAIDIMTTSTSLTDSRQHGSGQDVRERGKQNSSFQKAKSVGGMMDNVDSSTVLHILDNIGQKLEHERRMRERAEDWAEFLTTELEAHIDARTDTEARYATLRQHYIDFKGKSKERYQKLKSDHKALLLQIQDITHEGSSSNKDTAPNVESPKPFVNRGLLRRNRSQTDRNALLAKRNAMMIRGSTRQHSSGDSESAEDDSGRKPLTTTAESPTIKTDVSEPIAESLTSVRASWEKQYEKKQEEKKSERQNHRPQSFKTPQKPQIPPGSEPKTRHNLSVPRSPEGSDSTVTTKIHLTSTPKTPKSPVTSTVSPPVPDEHLRPTSNGTAQSNGGVDSQSDKVVNVKAFTNMWEQKLSSVPFKTMTSSTHITAREELKGSSSVNVLRSSSFNRSPASEPNVSTKKRPTVQKRDKNDNLEVSLDLDLEYLSHIEDTELEDDLLNGISSFSTTEGVLNNSIDTKQAFNMFEKTSSSTPNTPRDAKQTDKPSRRLSYSASVKEARSKFASQSITVNGSSMDGPGRRPRSKTDTSESSDVSPCPSPAAVDQQTGTDRSTKFSSLMSKWQQGR